jgi:hypothetical protein
MLVTYPSFRKPVGIAISQWEIDGMKRTFVLIPLSSKAGDYADVECAVEEDDPFTIISPSSPKWGRISNGFGDNAYGYPYDERIRDTIYEVWDNCATDGKRYEELYEAFEDIIDFYAEPALTYLQDLYDKQREAELAEAKKNGWDSSLVNTSKAEFPYPY